MKISMVCSEANPFVKTGGLADVTYSLSKELVKMGEDVAIFVPFYNQVKAKNLPVKYIGNVVVDMSWRKEIGNILYLECDGIKYYFIENQHYFERDGIYGYYDDGERFAFFTIAAAKAMEAVKFKPDIIHTHDWQPGMLFCYIRENHWEFYKDSKFVLSIHNPAFQGFLHRDSLGDLYGLPGYLFDNGTLEFKGMVSTLKAAIMYANKIVTVSPTHREELLTPEGSMGLNYVLRYREYDFTGYLNGIDYVEFNPSEDKYVSHPYSVTNFVSNKKLNKEEICERFNLKNKTAPLFSLVSRITWQKGMELVFPAVRELARKGANVILLGSGEYDCEQEMERIRATYPDNVGIYIGYNNELAHKIYASSDFFLMPSLFEPCGLGQMIAQRYGTLPIVRRTGGLRDSVINYDGSNEATSNGFGFDNYTVFDMVQTTLYALDCYEKHQDVYRQLVRNALKTDNSWQKSVKQYYALYKSLL